MEASKICATIFIPFPTITAADTGHFCEQSVIEFAGFLASSALSIDAVRNHYSNFLEMNHLSTWPTDKKKKRRGRGGGSELLRKFLPHFLCHALLVFFFLFWEEMTMQFVCGVRLRIQRTFTEPPRPKYAFSFFFSCRTLAWASRGIPSSSAKGSGRHSRNKKHYIEYEKYIRWHIMAGKASDEGWKHIFERPFYKSLV